MEKGQREPAVPLLDCVQASLLRPFPFPSFQRFSVWLPRGPLSRVLLQVLESPKLCHGASRVTIGGRSLGKPERALSCQLTSQHSRVPREAALGRDSSLPGFRILESTWISVGLSLMVSGEYVVGGHTMAFSALDFRLETILETLQDGMILWVSFQPCPHQEQIQLPLHWGTGPATQEAAWLR